MPIIKDLQVQWVDSSTWPVSMDSTGTYLRAPKYYGTCADDANTTVAGVLQVLTSEEYQTLRTTEYQARKPYPSWIGNEEAMTWAAPVSYPDDNQFYRWDELTTSWVAA